MTAQVPDSLTIDGRRWAIKDWIGNRGCVPTNEDFGIETVGPSTQNWSGRIDHYMVHRGHLYLFKLEVTLVPGFDRGRLAGRRRETVCRYEPMTRFDSTGLHAFMKEWHFEYLVLDDCQIGFTGELQLKFPYIDAWEVPSAHDADESNAEWMTLEFKQGELVL